MEYGGEDPYDSLVSLCLFSRSQEDLLRHSPFAPEPYNPGNDAASASPSEDSSGGGGGGIPIASTPIRMVSLSDSDDEVEVENVATADDRSREDEFLTPPEEAAVSSSGEFRPAADVFGYDSGLESVATVATVDLRRDSDLGFPRESPNLEANRLNSEIEVSQMENLGSDLMNFEVNRLNLSLEVVGNEIEADPFDLGIELTQRESLDSGAKQPNLEVSRALAREISLKDGLLESPLKKSKVSEPNSPEPSVELQSSKASPSKTVFDFIKNDEIEGETSSMRRKTMELGDDKDGVSESMGDDHQRRLSTKDFVDAMNNEDNTEETEAVARRRLPSSITGRSANVVEDDKDRNEMTIFDVLNLLVKDCDDEAPSCSFVKIYKRRGLTFPKPTWWPENLRGFDW